MAKQFPHMKDSEFPHVQNVDVYKYANEFDYSRYDYSQMNLTVCCVPWDMGEAHIGNRTISGIGNVVYFGSAEKRDKWFADIPDNECFRWESKYKDLHRDNEIVVPLPFDVASKYNYLCVQYHLFANDSSPVEYENGEGLKKWFWFIREVEFLSPNSTKLHLLNDAWQTFIYDIEIPYMVLERGHAPMFETPADLYLSNPVQNSQHLLMPDSVNENTAVVRKPAATKAFDIGNMYVVMALTVDPSAGFGTMHSDTWNTHAQSAYVSNGVPNYRFIAIEAAQYVNFCTAIDEYAPQVKQCVKSVFVCSSSLLSFGSSFTFADTTCYHVQAKNTQTEPFIDFGKQLFNFGSRYANIAKLYTYPYSWIEITDENGNAQQIRIEETEGHLDINYMLNAALPAININAYITGASIGSVTVDFKTLDARSLTIDGDAFQLQWEWAIPQFAVIQSAHKQNDFDYWFEKQQLINDYTTNKTNTDTSALAAKNNADASAATAKANTTRTTTAQTNNKKAVNDAYTQKNIYTNTCITDQYTANIAKLDSDYSADDSYIAATTQQNIDYISSSAWTNAAAGVGGSTAMGLISGGPEGAAIGAASGLVSGAGSVVSANIVISKDQNMATISHNQLYAKTLAAKTHLNANTLAVTTMNNMNMTKDKELNTTLTTNSVNAQNSNATASKETAEANALRTYNATTGNATRTRDNAIAAIDNRQRDAGMNAPIEYAQPANVGSVTTKPKMLLMNIITQSNAGISFAGDEFLRYGYRLNQQWQFNGNWCVGRHFTYWKLSDFWVRNLKIPDMYMDKIRFFLFGGVTVWSNPNDIGRVSIYENGI